MKGDFSRNTFDPRHRFSRVLMQQGRVLLDADWNEQTSILLHYLRTLTKDLIGPHGGPGGGFAIGDEDDDGEALELDFTIGRGRYYVDGILCENLAPVTCPAKPPPPLYYSAQPDDPDPEELDKGTSYLVYLDVWERHLTHLQAEHVREVALGGPDTASRAKVVWQVKVAREKPDTPDDATCADLLDRLVERRSWPCLKARARVDKPCDEPCVIPPEARYRGAENQLYRVEIHDGGEAGKDGATFKWSRDNGSVVFAIRTLKGGTARLESLGPDERRSLKEGDWVEIVDDRSVLRGEPRPLLRVDAVDRVGAKVTLAVPDGASLPVFEEDGTTHPLLRRWDQCSDAIPLVEDKWLDLEAGVQVCFAPDGRYRSGDYWLIPARTATGDVLWPVEDGSTSPKSLPPDGIEHHYAPLARLSLDAAGKVSSSNCRCVFKAPCAAAEPADDGDRPDGPGRADAEKVVLLRRISDVGEARAKLLLSSGHDTAAAVATLQVSAIMSLLAVKQDVAERIQASAREIAAGEA